MVQNNSKSARVSLEVVTSPLPVIPCGLTFPYIAHIHSAPHKSKGSPVEYANRRTHAYVLLYLSIQNDASNKISQFMRLC
jgi:hypothetical protein